MTQANAGPILLSQQYTRVLQSKGCSTALLKLVQQQQLRFIFDIQNAPKAPQQNGMAYLLLPGNKFALNNEGLADEIALMSDGIAQITIDKQNFQLRQVTLISNDNAQSWMSSAQVGNGNCIVATDNYSD